MRQETLEKVLPETFDGKSFSVTDNVTDWLFSSVITKSAKASIGSEGTVNVARYIALDVALVMSIDGI